jgi:hypothetical protein
MCILIFLSWKNDFLFRDRKQSVRFIFNVFELLNSFLFRSDSNGFYRSRPERVKMCWQERSTSYVRSDPVITGELEMMCRQQCPSDFRRPTFGPASPVSQSNFGHGHGR